MEVVIKGFSNYSVNSNGEVFSFNHNRTGKKKKLSPGVDNKGYLRVGLVGSPSNRSTKKIHRLVAEAFISNPKNKPQVNHKNGIRSDNKVENLEWCTNKENVQHSIKTLGRKRYGMDSHRRILTEYQVREALNLKKQGDLTTREISLITKINYHTLLGIFQGNRWKYLQ